MKQLGYGMLMTSTQVDEKAQHFYRQIGFKDSGSLLISQNIVNHGNVFHQGNIIPK